MELSVKAGLPCEVDIKSNLHIDGEETIFLKEFGHSNLQSTIAKDNKGVQ